MERYDLAIIGGGASGMAAAITAGGMGDRVLILEKAPSLGRKIAASGNGRCNLMNIHSPIYYGDRTFAEKVVAQVSQAEMIRFWNDLGLFLSEEDEGRIYPATFQSASVLDAMKTKMKMLRTEIRLQTTVTEISRVEDCFTIHTSNGDYSAGRVLIATGGIAQTRLGGSDSGYHLLQKMGHRILPQRPALCPIRTDSRSVSGLAGIRVRCGISLYDGSHTLLHKEKGEALFTEYGISGICAMQCARFIEEDGCRIELDLASRFFREEEDTIRILKKRREQFATLAPEFLLNGIFVPKLSFAILKQAGIQMKDRKAGDLSDAEIEATAGKMYRYTLEVCGTRGMEEAQVTAGGAATDAFRNDTMESKTIPGLFASGEVLNVDGDCGGYNLMFAFATGILAGANGRERKGMTGT